ncbi:hypothetical protein LVB77_15015 [Lysobacter sp. 5GHs7-4]|uniref:hypothetical protein n=1 Tax=Lysobacter sp. 5GHs7-4 TaxID=2904253 RepID=UPI001E428491|nr:hypothetical protein [Lysobacter sp. 5GHs7-4]UHQ21974.1 hypothetical protein LVB77_15015 [Lysobacter sp. 5GHs7-4]
MKRYCTAVLALALALPGMAAEPETGGWRSQSGEPVPDTDAMRSVQGFAGRLLLTADRDWEQKWNTPAEHTPRFDETDEVCIGGRLTMLTFLANPKVGDDGMTDVACDVLILRPDGSASTGAKDLPCFKVELKGDPTHIYLSATNLEFIAEPGDPLGRWTLRVTLKDRLRGVEVPLSTGFTVK